MKKKKFARKKIARSKKSLSKKFDSKTIFLVSGIVAIAFFGIFLLNALKFFPTGFLSLSGANADSNSLQETVPESPNGIGKNSSGGNSSLKTIVSGNLSFEIVEPSKLEVNFLKGTLLPCTQFSELVFEIKNVGSAKAEKFSIKPSDSLNLKNCINCLKNFIPAGQKFTAILTACNILGQNVFVEFYSVNSGTKRIEIG